jgi:enoyl-CoA hydratase
MEMQFENIIFEVRGKIALLTLNRPDAMNAIDTATIDNLDAAFDEIEMRDGIRGVILTGNGRAFCAGDDIKLMSAMDAIEARAYIGKGQNVINRIDRCPKPVLAAVNGYALGGGTELSLACDFIYASAKARFGLPEVDLGVIPGFGGTQRLPRLVGKPLAKEFIFTGRSIMPDEALRIGMINRICAHEKLLEEAFDTMEIITSKPKIAVTAAKKSIDQGYNEDIYKGIDYELQIISLCFATADQKEGMKAFMEKRQAKFL